MSVFPAPTTVPGTQKVVSIYFFFKWLMHSHHLNLRLNVTSSRSSPIVPCEPAPCSSLRQNSVFILACLSLWKYFYPVHCFRSAHPIQAAWGQESLWASVVQCLRPVPSLELAPGTRLLDQKDRGGDHRGLWVPKTMRTGAPVRSKSKVQTCSNPENLVRRPTGIGLLLPWSRPGCPSAHKPYDPHL